MILYHATSKENRDSIQRLGLLASKDKTGFGAVFLSDKLSVSGGDVWQVDCAGLSLEDDLTTCQDEEEYGRWWMTFEDIPPSRLTLGAELYMNKEVSADPVAEQSVDQSEIMSDAIMFYHGTCVEEWSDIYQYSSHLYLTDDPKVAAHYAAEWKDDYKKTPLVLGFLLSDLKKANLAFQPNWENVEQAEDGLWGDRPMSTWQDTLNASGTFCVFGDIERIKPKAKKIAQKNMFESFSDNEKEPWLSGKCMYLAAALHRCYGYPISVVLDAVPANGEALSFAGAEKLLVVHNDQQPYVGHAWMVMEDGDCLDIDGVYPLSQNGWSAARPGMATVTGLNEAQLKTLVGLTCAGDLSDEQWQAEVGQALDFLAQHAGVVKSILKDKMSVSGSEEAINESSSLGMC